MGNGPGETEAFADLGGGEALSREGLKLGLVDLGCSHGSCSLVEVSNSHKYT